MDSTICCFFLFPWSVYTRFLSQFFQTYSSVDSCTGEKKCLNSELWHACAGPLVSLPAVGSRVVYFPQGHSEQVGIKGLDILILWTKILL